MIRTTRIRKRFSAARGNEGSALVLALLFLTVCGVSVGGMLTFANTSSDATIALRASRGTEFDAQGAMQVAIATVRTGVACTTNMYTPTSAQLNNPPAPLRVDCYQILVKTGGSSAKRNDVFYVCPTTASAPCDTQARVRANVTFYDSPTLGYSIGIAAWSSE